MSSAPVSVAADYGAVADLYAELFANEIHDNPDLRIPLDRFAEAVGPTGRVADAGCGLGQVASYLRAQGLDIVGVDLTPEMLAAGRPFRDDTPVALADTQHLPFPNRSMAGVLSRFVIIHLPPSSLVAAFQEFARVLDDGGHLALSFFGARAPDHGATFDHKASLAYRWDPDEIEQMLADVGIHVLSTWWAEPVEPQRFPGAGLLAQRATRT